MLQELMLESLRWCTRDQLELIQPHSRKLHKMIESGSGSLPLRTLERVDMAYSLDDTFQIEVIENKFPDFRYGYPVGCFRASMRDAGDFEAILLRLKHSFVKKFFFDNVHTAFLPHFIENAARLGIEVERVEFRMPAGPTNVDFDRVGAIINLLRPLAYNVWPPACGPRRLRVGPGLYLNETAYF